MPRVDLDELKFRLWFLAWRLAFLDLDEPRIAEQAATSGLADLHRRVEARHRRRW